MGIWGQLFGGNEDRPPEEEREVKWIRLQSHSQLEELDNNSVYRSQVIFKHSTTCGISSMVLRRLEQLMEGNDSEADLYFLDVHRHREISNAISGRYQLRHQSPQLLILKKGKLIAEASHGAIAELNLEQYL